MCLRRSLPLKRNQPTSRSSSEANSQFDEGRNNAAGVEGIIDGQRAVNGNEDLDNQESASNEEDYEPSKSSLRLYNKIVGKIPHGMKYNNKKKLYCICQQEYQSGIRMFYCEGMT